MYKLFAKILEKKMTWSLCVSGILFFLFLGGTAFEIFSFLSRNLSEVAFGDGSSSRLFEWIQRWIPLDPAGWVSASFLSVGYLAGKICTSILFAGVFGGTIFFGVVFSIFLMMRLFPVQTRGKKAGVGFLGGFFGLCGVGVLTLVLIVLISGYGLLEAKKTIGIRQAEMIGDIDSGEGKIIGGVQNIIGAFQKNGREITGIEGGVTKEELFFLYAEADNAKAMSWGNSVLIPLILKHHPEILSEVTSDMFLLPGGELAVQKFSEESLQVLIPAIAPMMIQQRFSEYPVSFRQKESAFSVLSEEKYNEYQTKKIEETKEDIKDVIAQITAYIAKANAVIGYNNKTIESASQAQGKLESQKKKYVSDLQNMYNTYCKGVYKDADECKDLKKQIAENKRIIENAQNEVASAKATAQSENARALSYKKEANEYLGWIKDVLQSVSENPVIPEYQLGLFSGGDNAIYVKYAEGMDFEEYFATGVHEYAHALTFDTKSVWPLSLEEAMTEYVATASFANMLVKEEDVNNLGISYPDEVRVLVALFDRFGKERMVKLYFEDKSREGLEKILKEQFPNTKDLELFEKQWDALFYIPLNDRESRDKTVDLLVSLLKSEEDKQ